MDTIFMNPRKTAKHLNLIDYSLMLQIDKLKEK